ncbi:MAG TPA: LytTR family DNA-binding domain-containing protein [Thermoanaerobaculia bacterium]|nr:LytTR family DNA-binding domain-containing protein [Thermoanaerobaculia bacterium]
MIRALIVDDEPLARSRVRAMLGPHPDIEVVAECSSVSEASELLRTQSAALLLLDIEMPGASGFELVRTTAIESRPAIVFITAHQEFALEAFEASAIDYLVKPFSQERFDRALGRVRRFVEGKGAAPSRARRGRERFGVRLRGEVVFIKVASIDWIAAAGNYVRLYSGTESHLLRESLQNIAAELDPAVFIRVHRSAIVNLERVRKLIPSPDGSLSIVLYNDTTIPLGPSYHTVLEQVLGEKF